MKKKAERPLIDLVSQNLKILRAEAGMTQQELAAKAGFNVSHISRLESTPQNITLIALSRLAKALNCSVVKLVSRIDEIKVAQKAKTEFEDALGSLERFGKRLWSGGE